MNANDNKPASRLRSRIGCVLIALSGVLWFSLFGVPFPPISSGAKIVLGGGIFAGVQFAWWTGAALVGPEAVRKLRNVFRRRKEKSETPK